jgi:hypothetical protein
MWTTIKRHVTHAIRLAHHAVRKIGEPRSSQWPALEKRFLQAHPYCAACGGQVKLNVHHKKPFHAYPALELVESNLTTLCMEIGKHCHLLLGHGDNFKCFNPTVDIDARRALELYRLGDEASLEELAMLIAKSKLHRRER